MDMVSGGPKTAGIAERFWAKVRKGHRCWEWTAGADRGKRLWRVSSVRRYLDKLAREQRVRKPTLMKMVEEVAK